MKKVLTVDVYRNSNDSQPFNKFDGLNTLNLISTKDVEINGPSYHEADLENEPLIGIFRDVLCGEEIYRAFPVDINGNKLPKWWMMGGNYVSTSDSRFPLKYPVRLMDRNEN